MESRQSVRFFVRFAVAAAALALIAHHLANTDGIGTTRALSPHPTWTFTPIPSVATPTPTPTPPTPTPTPAPPTPTPTPTPLSCSGAVPSVDSLWPPNQRFVAVEVLGVNDQEGDSVAITIDRILQDEAVDAPGSGSTSPDGRGVGTGTAEVRAERVGGGNGRFYHIYFTAVDGGGETCTGEVHVGVPRGEKHPPGDDGPLFDSTVAIP